MATRLAIPLGIGGGTWLLLGSAPVAAVGATVAFLLTPAIAVRERRRRAEHLTDAWPRLLDEARVLSGPGGLSLAHALFTAGRSASPALRAAWAEAERTWRLSADLPRSLRAVTRELDDPTSELVCSTLAVIDGAGGGAQAEQLARLAVDRRRDAATRRSAEAELAGARFARRFVLIVPAGMALAGQAVGTGRAAFGSAPGQLAALAAVAVTGACWVWSGRLLTVPTAPGTSR
jgi:tight adherence protein B